MGKFNPDTNEIETEDNIMFQKFGHNLIWSENNYIQGHHIEKASLLLAKRDLLSAQTIKYYDGHIDAQSAKEFIEASTDDEIVTVCEALSALSGDFSDDIAGWGKHLNGNTYDQIGDFAHDPKVCRTVMSMCGGGYTKLYGLYHKTISQPDLLFINQPMSSLHPNLGEAILSHLESLAPDTKFIITDSNGFENLEERWLEM